MPSQPQVLGLLADPGVPQNVTDALADEIAERLTRRTGTPWETEVSHFTFPLNDDGTVPFSARAPGILERNDWRYLVYLTDLPRALDQRPVIAEVDAAGRSTMISLPSLGALRLQASARDLIVDLVEVSTRDAQRPVDGDELVEGIGVSHVAVRPGLETDVHYLVRPGPSARLRQIAGMVRTNRPGRLVTALSGGIAAGLASGGFGVFFGSIWTLAVAVSPARHVLIGVVMVLTFTLWLITRNRLWFHDRAATGSGRAAVENIATFVTVLLSVVMVFALLFVALGALSVIVIDADYLASQLGYAPGPGDYIAIVSMSVSMGLLAGALGSNFDDADAVRIATYSKRGHEQREKLDEYRDEQEEEGSGADEQDRGGDPQASDARHPDEQDRSRDAEHTGAPGTEREGRASHDEYDSLAAEESRPGPTPPQIGTTDESSGRGGSSIAR
ncbi:hypothetical protein [Kocuria palustris]|uniref:hypothetical protein n=1 Tax=Kocuria palustris TaxID=71999 RepID=UPI0011A879AF|nr:hypothetical protein [Kocuria palustris]